MPKLTNLRKIVLLILIISILFSLTGCSMKEKIDENSKKEKIDQEMSYLDTKIVTMMNRLNNISFSNYRVISEDVKEENTGSTSGNEKNNSSQSDSSSDTGSSSSSSDSGSGSAGETDKSNESSSKGSGASEQPQSSENSQIFRMAQDVLLLNTDEQEEQNEEIKWGEIRKDIENIYTVWATISIDLASMGVNNEQIEQFNSILDDVAVDAKEKNKDSALIDLAELYNLISIYMNSYSEDELNKNIIITKSYVLNSYSLVNEEKWNEAQTNIVKANEAFSNIMTHQDDYPNRELNINRSYLLLNDLKKSTEKQDKQIFYVRYKNLLQDLNIIS